MALGPAGQTALLRRLGPVAPLATVAANLPRNRRFVHPKFLRRLGLVQPGFTVGVNRVSLLLGELCVVLHRCSFDLPVGKTTSLPPLAHSARQPLGPPAKLHFEVEFTSYFYLTGYIKTTRHAIFTGEYREAPDATQRNRHMADC